MFIAYILLFFISTDIVHSDDKQWENPLDYFFSKNDDSENVPGNEVLQSDNDHNIDMYMKNEGADFHGKCKRSLSGCSSFLLRFVNIILQDTGLKDYYMGQNEDTKTVNVDISVTKESLSILQKFSNSECVPLTKLNECFVTLFQPVNDNTLKSAVNGTYSYGLITSTVGVSLLCCFLYYVVLTKHKLSFFSIICFIYFCAVVFNLWHQYEEIKVKQLVALEKYMHGEDTPKIPKECFPSKLPWTEYFRYVVSSEDPCEEYKKLKKNIISEIDFNKVFYGPVYGFVLSYLPSMSEATGKSIADFSSNFPFPLNYVIPIILPSLFIIFCLPYLMRDLFHCSFKTIFSRWRYGSNYYEGERKGEATLPPVPVQPIFNLTINSGTPQQSVSDRFFHLFHPSHQNNSPFQIPPGNSSFQNVSQIPPGNSSFQNVSQLPPGNSTVQNVPQLFPENSTFQNNASIPFMENTKARNNLRRRKYEKDMFKLRHALRSSMRLHKK